MEKEKKKKKIERGSFCFGLLCFSTHCDNITSRGLSYSRCIVVLHFAFFLFYFFILWISKTPKNLVGNI